MKIPIDLLEEEEVAQLTKFKKECYVVGKDIVLSERVFEKLTDQASDEGIKQLAALRAAITIQYLYGQAKTVSDKAAVVAAALAVISLDARIGKRLMRVLRYA